MTEASENTYLVRVRAQVMTRDEATGGWVALGGGGLADVRVGKRPRTPPHQGEGNGDSTSSSTALPPTHDYFIHGKRISDNMVVLECTIKKDFQYNKVMPTFHHWVTEEKRFGLTFQTAADARAFDRGVRTAVDQLLQGLGGSWSNVYKHKETGNDRDDDDEHNIFECLNLPSDSRSSSENSTASRVRRRDDLSQTPILSAITLPRHSEPLKQFEIYDDKSGVEELDSDRFPYVHLSAVHEYNYPQVGSGGVICSEKSSPNTKPPLMKRDSGSLKKAATCPLPDKKPAATTFQARLKCRYCHAWYAEGGACEFAPDAARRAVDSLSCISCAQGLLYHCMSDSEEDRPAQACECAEPSKDCATRWLGVTLLSLLVPCLWCYWPLRCLHHVLCPGPRHAPMH